MFYTSTFQDCQARCVMVMSQLQEIRAGPKPLAQNSHNSHKSQLQLVNHP